MKILVLNSGSSSIKYRLFERSSLKVLASGIIEKIGEPRGVANHETGLKRVIESLKKSGALNRTEELSGVGHRVVHGGDVFREAARVDAKVIAAIRKLIPLAPLHNGPNLLGIEVARRVFKKVPQVAVFDTAFHQTLPPHAFHYALPRKLCAKHRIRRYGFHGTSHHYVAKRAAAMLGRSLRSLNLITLHLGNGASITAIQNGKSVDTSMGMTPLEGLIMGTRCGDIDPALSFYIERAAGKRSPEVEILFNEQSGLRGICGANDMRQVEKLAKSGNAAAKLALEMFCYRIRKYIGAYTAALGRVDALIFTAGIGENSARVRELSCAGLKNLGIAVDPKKNRSKSRAECQIQAAGSAVKILVVPTDEEREIAEHTRALIKRK